MQSELNSITKNVRKILRPKLKQFPKIHKLTIDVHRKYCDITGFMHILPDFYVLGGEKCGSSALYEYIIKHPHVESAVTKEIHYFDRWFSRGLNWYRVCFPFSTHKFFSNKITKRDFLTGEATPRYLYHPHSLDRIKKLTPNAKFLIILRNPIDRAFSHYNMNVNIGYEKLSFEDAIESESSRTENEYEQMQSDENYYSRPYYRYSYLERGIYYKFIENWFDHFPKEQFLILKSEDLLKTPQKTYPEILDFLNLKKWLPNEFKPVRESSYGKRTMKPETRKSLGTYFEPFNQKLYHLVNRDFGWN